MAKGIGRNGELFRTLCEPAHLMACARSAARGKKRKPDAAAFLLNMEPECFRLAAELAGGTWVPGAYRSYVIREPKPRLISAAPFADRVVHHALVSLLEPHFERRFVAHSYACRVGRGTASRMRAMVGFRKPGPGQPRTPLSRTLGAGIEGHRAWNHEGWR